MNENETFNRLKRSPLDDTLEAVHNLRKLPPIFQLGE